ncbi:MAG TPA: hypothetical protein VNZ53_16905 [Steroidobacteraceae bacterium]|nr:hypothetical protein [Steroidobacteraceae bacterium]
MDDIADGKDRQISLIAAFSGKMLAGSALAPGPCNVKSFTTFTTSDRWRDTTTPFGKNR